MTSRRSSEVRAALDHPVIDGDGHFIELAPMLHDDIVATLEQIGGTGLRDRYVNGGMRPTDTSTSVQARTPASARDVWSAQPSWWGWPTANTKDRAAAHLPGLMHERLDEMGIDFMLIYPSMVMSFLDWNEIDGELGAALCRAVNIHNARLFAPYRDRITPAAIIPMSSPTEAIDELDFAVRDLGFKVGVVSAYARRPIPRIEREHGPLTPPVYRLDHFALDSEYDYDPFWQKCVELGFSPTCHSSLQYHDLSRSISNYQFNHIDAMAKSHESLAKALFLGGVTNRFPSLRFGFLEGGVAWAVMLYASLVGHWEKRNPAALMPRLDPASLDVDALMTYVHRYGDRETRDHADALRRWFSAPGARPDNLDEYAAAGITRVEDVHDRFVPNFYFGCEADDPLLAWAFDQRVNPLGARLRPIFGSDVSHWDVWDIEEPVAEAWELVDKGLITEDDFREFVFTNPLRLHAVNNPGIFDGTRVEVAAREAIGRGDHRS